jgi:glycosyltransferase involved in cell wall biosynthesis
MLPWIADLRDLWSDDHFRRRSRLKRSVLRFIEKRVLKDAKAIVTVSEPWADKLRSTLGCARDRVKVIENGFDEEDFASADYGKNEKFTITYTGKLHKEHQDISIFFRALSELVKKGDVDINKMHVRFYVLGHDRPDLMKLAEAYGISAAIEEAGKVNFIKSAEAQRASDALLFVQWQGAGQDGWCSAKLYDYIGSGRPIIAIAGKGGIIDEIISRTSSGTVADALDPLKAEISRLYNEHARNGRIEHTGNDGEIAACSRKLKAKQLAGLFDSALTSKGAR